MKRYVAATAAALALLGAACGSDYGRDDAVEDMIEGGFSEEQANCVADGAEEKDIPWDAAEESLDEGGEYFDAIREILAECVTDE